MRIVLVHGAWGSAAGWGRVPGLLAERGHQVEAVDLPGHGTDPTPPGSVTLEHYSEALATRLAGGAPAVLVGHSMGGMAISATAERTPERVARLIYVAAFLPRDGQSLLDLKRLEPQTIGHAVRPGREARTTELDPDLAAEVLFQDADLAQKAAGLAALGAQPNAAQTDRVRLTPERFGSIPRSYILCTEDRTVTPWLQELMCRENPCERVERLKVGHFPQLTRPAELAALIDALAEPEVR